MSSALGVTAYLRSSPEHPCVEAEWGRAWPRLRLGGTAGRGGGFGVGQEVHVSPHETPGCLRLSPMLLSCLVPVSVPLLTPDSCPATRCHQVLLLFPHCLSQILAHSEGPWA